MTSRSKGILCIIASAFGFALMAFCVRLCDNFGEPISCFQKSFFRNAIACVVAAVALFRRHAHDVRTAACLPRHRKAWTLLLLRSTLGSVGIFANFYALGHISIAEGQTLNKTAPFFTVLLAGLFLKERVSRRQLGVLLLAFCGVLLIAKPGFAGAETFPLAMGLLGGLCAGAAYVCLRSMRTHQVDAAFIVFFFSVFSCVLSALFLVNGLDPMTDAQLLILVGAGVGAALGQFGITLAYGFAAPREVAVYDYTNIIFTALLSLLFLGQLPDACSLLGCATIIAAGVIMSYPRTIP